MIEYIQNIERVMQPTPSRNPGGDCFACTAVAGLRFLYPERQISIDDVWEFFLNEYYDGNAQDDLEKLRNAAGALLEDRITTIDFERVFEEVKAKAPKKALSNTWSGFKQMLDKVSRAWGKLEITWDMVEPHFDSDFGHPSWSYAWRYQDLSLDYTRRLEGWLRGGWVAWTEVRLHGGGPFEPSPDGGVSLRSIDHFLLIDGVRHRYVETLDENGKFKYGSWKDEIHVVDSSLVNLTGWHETRHFTRSHGASSWWLARRDQR